MWMCVSFSYKQALLRKRSPLHFWKKSAWLHCPIWFLCFLFTLKSSSLIWPGWINWLFKFCFNPTNHIVTTSFLKNFNSLFTSSRSQESLKCLFQLLLLYLYLFLNNISVKCWQKKSFLFRSTLAAIKCRNYLKFPNSIWAIMKKVFSIGQFSLIAKKFCVLKKSSKKIICSGDRTLLIWTKGENKKLVSLTIEYEKNELVRNFLCIRQWSQV